MNGGGDELRMRCPGGIVQHLRKDVVAASIGNDHADALLGELGGHMVLGQHAATADAALLGADPVLEILARQDAGDDLGGGIVRRAVIDTIAR